MDDAALAARVIAGERAALARALTRLERDPAAVAALDRALAPHTGRCYTVGITGAPGAGKSTLVGALLDQAIAAQRRTAVLALDPRSPLTNGAILGDRMRMERAAIDTGVFIRSMTADPHGGGLSATTPLAVRALDAAGWPWVLIETVGVGQSELDIVEAAATTVVVLNPGWGDEVQAVKAGLMEVADVFVINKADRPGAAELRQDLERLLAGGQRADWQVPIVETVAHEGRGLAELWKAIDAPRTHQLASGGLATRRRRFSMLAVRALAARLLGARLDAALAGQEFSRRLDSLERGECGLGDLGAALVAEAIRT